MSNTNNALQPERVLNPNDPRRDKAVIYYDKENISKITADSGAGNAEFYQMVSMFIGIFAFMMKVRTILCCYSPNV